MSEVVVELEIVKVGSIWYRKGLDRRGNECWEELEEVSDYGELSVEEMERLYEYE